MPEFDEPQSRNEALLQNILGAENELPDPQSRNEAILYAIANDLDEIPEPYEEPPQSRIEALLVDLYENGGGGGGGDVPTAKALNLYDWEGTLLFGYTAAEAQALTALPAPSASTVYQNVDHELLQFQEWNWSLANIKTWMTAHSGQTLNVGAIYTTTDGQNHNYWLNPNLTYLVSVYTRKTYVTTVGSSQFENYYSLKSINIPDGVTSIGNNAFKDCGSLTSINIPDGVTSIGTHAFENCGSLTSISIPNSITSIGSSAFVCCYSLIGIIIPDSVTSIGGSTFSNCYSLSGVIIPNSVTSIDQYAFASCLELYDVVINGKPSLANTNAFGSNPATQKIYVHRADLSWYQTAANWSTLYSAGKIVAIEDYTEHLHDVGLL